jgi:MFS superfamily sulfate permease-like transporter
MALAPVLGVPGIGLETAVSVAFSPPSWPPLAELERAFSLFVLPQLSLTFTNAVLLTALIASDYFGERAAHVAPRRLSITSGLANLLLTPFGALPMCHGAGGLAAHYRFGARTGTAPLLLGLALLGLALLPGGLGLAVLGAIPAAALGALLIMAAGELALTKRLFDCRPSCWPVIAVTAGGYGLGRSFLGTFGRLLCRVGASRRPSPIAYTSQILSYRNALLVVPSTFGPF